MQEPFDHLLDIVQALNQAIWHRPSGAVRKWLAHFASEHQLAALYLLSRFSFFGEREVRELARALFRDLVEYPLLLAASEASADPKQFVRDHLEKTRFVPVGPPNKSSSLVMYEVSKENNLGSEFFVSFDGAVAQSTNTASPLFQDCEHLIIIDDFCGSGDQASDVLRELVQSVRANALGRPIMISYFVFVGSLDGLSRVQRRLGIDSARAVIELDESFKTFGAHSRYRDAAPVDWESAERICIQYGRRLFGEPLGHHSDELLVGFAHNTPDNTLPIFWKVTQPADSVTWDPIFPRRVAGEEPL